ncbi:MAG: hypothetical protein CMF41_00245 [Legionellales bacterium]|nr:hypothetical protein [Legionellales bacterium]
MRQTLTEFTAFLIEDTFLALEYDTIDHRILSNIIVAGSTIGALNHIEDHTSVAYHNFINYFYNPAIFDYAKTVIQEPITRSSIQNAIMEHLKLKLGSDFGKKLADSISKHQKTEIHSVGMFYQSDF